MPSDPTTVAMPDGPRSTEPHGGGSSDEAARLAREADLLREGRAQLDAGAGLPWPEVAAWLDRLDADPAAPLPIVEPRRPA